MIGTRTHSEESTPTPQEIQELVRRIQERTGGSPDLREHGLLTVSDIAEASGRTEAEVRQHLERIRAERALKEAPSQRKSQIPLLLLAVGMFATAFIVYKLTPRPLTEDEIDRRLAEVRAERQARLGVKKVTYPILNNILGGPNAPPRGVYIKFHGLLTETTAAADADAPMPSFDEAKEQLYRSFKAAFESAKAAEESAPKPTEPLKVNQKPFGFTIQPGSLVAVVNAPSSSTSFHVPLEPPAGVTLSAHEQWRDKLFRDTANSVVDSVRQAQLRGVKLGREAYNGDMLYPPPGYGVQFSGRRKASLGSAGLVFAPLDAKAAAARLRACTENLLRDDLRPSKHAALMGTRVAEAKTPTPEFSEVIYMGPQGKRVLKIPTAPSKQYPTAADVARAAEHVLDRSEQETIAEITKFNRERKYVNG